MVSATADKGKSTVESIPAAQLGIIYQGFVVSNVSLIPYKSVFTPEYGSPSLILTTVAQPENNKSKSISTGFICYPNAPSSATRRTRRMDCKPRRPAGFAASHGSALRLIVHRSSAAEPPSAKMKVAQQQKQNCNGDEGEPPGAGTRAP
jgi:hypothetical protein